ncbi:MAG: carboxypeptidase-like regulatory domain-containing protein [Prolixibacteraceae bacterium]|nr:carboxypeptidase-like regulatory domain-containing protein [Prolixibacteraceae bacterium]
MKKLALSLAILCVVLTSNAKNKNENSEAIDKKIPAIQISGNVIDKDSKEALVGVEVKIEELNMKTYTDFDGKFSFRNLKPGEYNIVASYISYEKNTIELPIEDKENNLISIKLESSN